MKFGDIPMKHSRRSDSTLVLSKQEDVMVSAENEHKTKKNERVEESAGQYGDADAVEAYAAHSRKGVMKKVERRFVKVLLKKFGHLDHLSILDVGTGPAWIPVALAKAKPAWKITALDASPLMLDRARTFAESQGVKVHFIQGFAEKTTLMAETYDLVISHYAFHEFPKPAETIAEMTRVLKKGGFLVIQDLLRPQTWLIKPLMILGSILNGLTQEMRRQYGDSLRAAYRPEELKKLLAGSGLLFSVRTFGWWAGGLLEMWGYKPADTVITRAEPI